MLDSAGRTVVPLALLTICALFARPGAAEAVTPVSSCQTLTDGGSALKEIVVRNGTISGNTTSGSRPSPAAGRRSTPGARGRRGTTAASVWSALV